MGRTIVPGEPLPAPDQRELREAGFEPGYPVYERNPNGSHVGEVYDILHLVTMYGYSLTSSPMMHVGLWLPTASGEGEHQPVPLQVWDIRRYWDMSGMAYWALKGVWHPKERKRCYVGRKCVYDWVVRVWIDQLDAVVQFVPKGGGGENLLDPDGDDFRWGRRSSKALPPPYRQ